MMPLLCGKLSSILKKYNLTATFFQKIGRLHSQLFGTVLEKEQAELESGVKQVIRVLCWHKRPKYNPS